MRGMKRRVLGLLLTSVLVMTNTGIGVSADKVSAQPGTYVQADPSITQMYNVPVTYYDYLDDQELEQKRGNYKAYGNDPAQGWSVFGKFNQELAQYYSKNLGEQQITGVYFGNLLQTDKAGAGIGQARAREVNWQVDELKKIYPHYWQNANNSNYLTDMHYSAQGLVYNQLNENGELQIANGVRAPWFHSSFLNTPHGRETIGKTVYSRFPFRQTKDSNGVSYYEFDSDHGTDNVVFNGNTFIYKQGSSGGVHDGTSRFGLQTSSDNGGYGFFPFNNSGNGPDGLNFGFGAEMEIRFNLPKGGVVKGTNGQNTPITFEFTGDDDVWVFIDGQLVLDLGGAHKKAHGKIDFSDLSSAVSTNGIKVHPEKNRNSVSVAKALGVSSSNELSPNKAHTLKIFYMERGMIESNLKIRFNMQPIEHEFSTEKEVNTVNINPGLEAAVKEIDEFNIQLNVDQAPAAAKKYELIDKYGDMTTGFQTDQKGNFLIRDGDKAVFKKQFDDCVGKNFTAVETVQDGGYRSTLTYDTTWEVTDVENSLQVATGNTTTANFTYNKKAGDEFTPVRLHLKYTNTPQIGSLSVTKNTVDKVGNQYVDTQTEFKFVMELDLGGGSTDQVIQEDQTDPTAVYFRKPASWTNATAYCYTDSKGNNADWPGVTMTYVKDNLYMLSGIRGTWEKIIFSDGGNNQIPGQNQNGAQISKQGTGNNEYKIVNNQLSQSVYQDIVEVTKPASGGYKGYPLKYTIGTNSDLKETTPAGAFVLKSGETAHFQGIPLGTKFRIREVQADGYTIKNVTINGKPASEDEMHNYGGIVKDTTDVKTIFTNQKEETSVNIIAHKQVDTGATAIEPKKFQFTLTGMSSELVDGQYTKDTSNVKVRSDNDINGNIRFPTLSYQEEGIYRYTIKELIPENDNTYKYDKSEYELKVVVQAGTRSMVPVMTVTQVRDRYGYPLNPGKPVADIGLGIAFDNYTNLAPMTVQKVLVQEDGSKLPKKSWPSQVTPFKFKLEKKGPDGKYQPCSNQKYTIPQGHKIETKYTDTAGQFTLSAEELESNVKITFPNLIIGTTYRIVEDLTDVRRYEFYTAIVNKEQRPKIAVGRTYSSGEILLQKGNNDVVFQNYPLSEISVLKKDGDGKPLQGVSFKLEKQNGVDWSPVEGYKDPVVTGKDGTVLFQYLKAGTYRITEVQTLEGNVLLKDPVEVTVPFAYKAGDIVNGQTVTSDGLSYKVTFTIINDKAFDLPTTGKNGITKYLMIGIALAVTAGVTLGLRQTQVRNNRRRRRKHSR